jgi:hypothetical protein
VVTRVAAAPYLWRLRLDFDGLDTESFTITNAELMSGALAMVEGPLKQLWRISGLTLAQAVDRCIEGQRVRATAFAEKTVTAIPIPAYGFGVSVDGDGKPQIEVQFPLKDFPIAGLASLEYRHSIDR